MAAVAITPIEAPHQETSSGDSERACHILLTHSPYSDRPQVVNEAERAVRTQRRLLCLQGVSEVYEGALNLQTWDRLGTPSLRLPAWINVGI